MGNPLIGLRRKLGFPVAFVRVRTYFLWAKGKIGGIDKFMSEARAITNHIGNCAAAVLLAIWEGELNWDTFREGLPKGSQTTI